MGEDFSALNPRLQQWIIGSAFAWSLGILTAGYLNVLKPDAAFIASILGSTIGAAGINLRKEESPAKKTEDKDAGSY
ncbi:hypothetical protein [Synechococcus lacustris]|uniref:hypothetical protein n=1 Tax=Synechococcus lacustris TaxID=2116544 RepID=UPI0020CD1702|nr:hypothetical protein [Synechococcus lacustris]